MHKAIRKLLLVSVISVGFVTFSFYKRIGSTYAIALIPKSRENQSAILVEAVQAGQGRNPPGQQTATGVPAATGTSGKAPVALTPTQSAAKPSQNTAALLKTASHVPAKPVSPPASTKASLRPTPIPVRATPAPAIAKSGYKDGSFTGNAADAYYGTVQVRATISGGRITGVDFLQYPNHNNTSISINSQAMPYLQQEAIQAQSANVNGVSGASATSQAFIRSLGSALSQAKA